MSSCAHDSPASDPLILSSLFSSWPSRLSSPLPPCPSLPHVHPYTPFLVPLFQFLFMICLVELFPLSPSPVSHPAVSPFFQHPSPVSLYDRPLVLSSILVFSTCSLIQFPYHLFPASITYPNAVFFAPFQSPLTLFPPYSQIFFVISLFLTFPSSSSIPISLCLAPPASLHALISAVPFLLNPPISYLLR